jgi:hypothetical protein
MVKRRFTWALWAHLTFVGLVGAAAWLGMLPFRVQAIHHMADKALHFLLIGGVAFWLVGVWEDARLDVAGLRLPLAVLVPGLVAALEEGLQLLSSRRNADWLDFAADALGLLVFWGLGRALIRRFESRESDSVAT